MTTLQAIELAAHIFGGFLTCSVCEACDCDRYEEAMSPEPYDDLAFGKWLLAEGWQFNYEEFDYEGGPGSGKFSFCFEGDEPTLPTSRSWTFSLVCPRCRAKLSVR